MSALRHQHTGSLEDKGNNIPLYPKLVGFDNGSTEKRVPQIIVFIAAGEMQSLINSLRNDYLTFCGQFAAGKKTMRENIAYTAVLEQKLRENHISFDIFVRATV